jgi:hypothetical protein
MKFGTNKHSSLFDLIVSDEENTFYDISPLVSSKWEERTIDVGLACCHFNRTFFFITDRGGNKLERLLQAQFFSKI